MLQGKGFENGTGCSGLDLRGEAGEGGKGHARGRQETKAGKLSKGRGQNALICGTLPQWYFEIHMTTWPNGSVPAPPPPNVTPDFPQC